MKKFFTFLCAMLIVVSASAVDLKKITSSGLTPVKVTSVDKKHAVPSKTARVAKLNKTVADFTLPQVMKNAKKAGEVIELQFGDTEPSFEWYGDTGDWYIGWIDNTSTYIVRLDYFTTYEGKYGHYTIDDLDLNYSYLSDYTSGTREDVAYTAADFTVSEGADGGMDLEATFSTEDGRDFHAVGHMAPHVAQTYDFKATSVLGATYYTYDTDWYMTIKSDDAQYTLYLDIVTGSDEVFAGEWTLEDMLEDYTSFIVDGSQLYFTELEITTTIPEGCHPKEACTIQGKGTLTNGDVVNIDVNVKAPLQPTETVYPNVEVLEFEWPEMDITNGGTVVALQDVDNPNHVFQLTLNGLTGTFNKDNMFVDYCGMVDYETLTPYALDHGSVTLAFDAETMSVKGVADIVLETAVEYVFEFSFKPEFKDEVNNQVYTNLNWDDSWGVLGIYFFDAENETTILDGYCYGDELASIGVVDKETNEITEPLAILSSDIDPFTPTVKASFVGSDMAVTNVDASFVLPEIQDEMTVMINVGTINNLLESMGAWQFSGYNEDNTLYASVALYSDQLEGEYDLTESMGDLKNYNVVVKNPNMEGQEAYYMYNGKVTVTKTGKNLEGYDVYTLMGDVQAGTHLVHLVLVGADAPAPVPGNEYDMQDEDVVATFDAVTDMIRYEYYEEDGMIWAQYVNENNEMISMVVYTASPLLEDGVYPINSDYEPGTVQAGMLDAAAGSVYPTFFGTLTDDGMINVPLYLCVDGTVTVSHDAEDTTMFEISATNTWGRTADIKVVSTVATGIKNATVKNAAKKYVNNNGVVIEKNGMKFNAVGQQMK